MNRRAKSLRFFVGIYLKLIIVISFPISIFDLKEN